MRVLLSGASGVIGGHLRTLIEADPALQLAGAAQRGQAFDPEVRADVLIDFSHPSQTLSSLEVAVSLGIPAVIGTTGLDAACEVAIEAAAKKIPVCVSANFSLGANLLLELCRQTAATLGPDFEIEISEIHHRRKLDAPSGTALALGQAMASARGTLFDQVRVDDRSHRRMAREKADIGVQAIRGGDAVGEHTVFFMGSGERLELTHRATDRLLFARGALSAAKKLLGRPPGQIAFSRLMLAPH